MRNGKGLPHGKRKALPSGGPDLNLHAGCGEGSGADGGNMGVEDRTGVWSVAASLSSEGSWSSEVEWFLLSQLVT